MREQKFKFAFLQRHEKSYYCFRKGADVAERIIWSIFVN